MLSTDPLSPVSLELVILPISSCRVLLVRALTVFEGAHVGSEVSEYVAPRYVSIMLDT
jgi:hypothetical protein